MLAGGSPKDVEESILDAEEQLKSLSDSGHDNLNNDPYSEVVLEPSEDPLYLSTLRKWLTVLIISAGSLCVTSMSSIAAFTEVAVESEFVVPHTVSILAISLFAEGLGIGPLFVGPLFVGPLSEVYGRYPIYPAYLIPRFLTGLSGAAFLSVAGGAVSDLFPHNKVANPMAVCTLSPFIGLVIGPLIGGFVNQNLYFCWTYRIILVWVFFQCLAIYLLVPETYTPVIIKQKAERTALLLGVLYLTFQAFPIIFGELHGFNMQMTGLTFLGMGLGMIIGISCQPVWNRHYAFVRSKYDGTPPESRLAMAKVGAFLVPVGLYWPAFTTYRQVHWIVPIITSIPFGTGMFVYTSVFTYLVTAYRPIAASAMASNSALRCTFTAAFQLFAPAMYRGPGTVGATALLAGLTTMTP
ncbi:MFS general substrate transporter [Pleurotus eryngii]|uniref:MFS general substrate transporter n=1 Tax=Pleurotus eryngii TaxID=5323 RepID=A0A9P6A2H0_PLEER|nr:MFS general substrate transporter [Pleurotus eryngii]